MECDVAVLGGGPGGYTAAIRAAQLGVRAVCIEQEPELGGTCLRVGCIPTKAWVQTAFALKEAEESFAKFGVEVGAAEARPADRERVEGGGRQADDRRRREPLQGERRRVGEGCRPLQGREHDLGRGRGGRHLQAGDRRDRVVSRCGRRSTGSTPTRCVDSTGLLAQEKVPKRLVVLGGGIIGCEFASIFERFGSEVTIIEMLPSLIPMEDADASKELAKQFGKRGIALQLGKQCTKVEDRDGILTVHFGEGETVEAELMLVSVGRAPLVEGLGLEELGVTVDRQGRDRDRRAHAADRRPAHLRRRRLRGLLAARAHRVPRGRGRRRARLRP